VSNCSVNCEQEDGTIASDGDTHVGYTMLKYHGIYNENSMLIELYSMTIPLSINT